MRLIFFAVFALVLVSTFGCGNDTGVTSQAASADDFGVPAGFSPQTTKISDTDCTVGAEPCRRIALTVPKGLSKELIDRNLRQAVKQAYVDYGAVRGIAFAYAEGTDTNGQYSAGRAQWGSDDGSGDPNADAVTVGKSIRVDYMDDYFKPEVAAPSVVAKIPENRRKKIAYEIALAEDRAQHEADKQYPIDGGNNAAELDQERQNVKPNISLNNRLEERYHARIQRRYHLTCEQFVAIIGEAGEKHWPTPDSSKD